MDDTDKIRRATASFLARREHSRFELQQKLARHTDNKRLIQQVITEFTEQNWQSDKRFAESYTRARSQRGYGPLHIKAELIAKGVDENIVEEAIADLFDPELQTTVDVYQKKYGNEPCEDLNERSKRMRFLQQRGFTQEQIKFCFRTCKYK